MRRLYLHHGNDERNELKTTKGNPMSIFKSQTIWTGNTYPIREAIKSLGGKWDANRKGWIVPALTMRERSEVYSRCNGLKGVTVEKLKN